MSQLKGLLLLLRHVIIINSDYSYTVGQRLSVIESHCLNLRMLYRDCSRPPAPKIERPRIEVCITCTVHVNIIDNIHVERSEG